MTIPEHDLYYELRRLSSSEGLNVLEACFQKHIESMKTRMLSAKTPDYITLQLKWALNEVSVMSPQKMCALELKKMELEAERLGKEMEVSRG
jgi:hypothetical protein